MQRTFLTEEERYTRIYKGTGELIDHILASRGMIYHKPDGGQGEWKVTEVSSLVASIEGQSIDDNPVDRVGKERPDHAPVYARFMV